MGWKGLLCVILAFVAVIGGCKKAPVRTQSTRMVKTPLQTFVESGDIEAMRSLIADGVEVNAKMKSYWLGDEVTPLHIATGRGDRDMAELLLSNGADVNAQNADGYTPLHLAVELGRDEIARLLIEKGADVNAKDRGGDSPLYMAVVTGDNYMAQLLIDAGANAEMKNWHGQSLLHVAISPLGYQHSADLIAPLIAAGADIDAVTPSGCTALHYAARNGDVRTVGLLLAYGANANARTTSGQTPLHFAAGRGVAEVVRLLLQRGADGSLKDRDGKAPLDYARRGNWEMVVALLTGGATMEGGRIEEEEPPTGSGTRDSLKARREPQTDIERLVSGNSTFAVDLYRRLGDREGNLVVAPYSISTVLAMAYAGARENTEKEMAATLHFLVDPQKVHPGFAALEWALNKTQEAGDIRLYLANSLWPQEGHPFLGEYLSLVKKYYGVSITAVDYRAEDAREATRQTINQWVGGKTENRIKDLIRPEHLTDATRLVLTNAIYFKGKWENEFDPKHTKDATFFVSASKSIQVPTMHQEEVFGYAETRSLQILEMPYRGGRLSMLLLLPTRIEGLKQLEHNLTVESLQDWRAALCQREVIVFLPKLRTAFQVELKATLQSMGMVEAFRFSGANFAGFDGDPNWFFLGEVIHKASVDADEEGTEVSAATAAEGMIGDMLAPPPVFRADHPFLFLIQENGTGSILFLGRVADPTQKVQ